MAAKSWEQDNSGQAAQLEWGRTRPVQSWNNNIRLMLSPKKFYRVCKAGLGGGWNGLIAIVAENAFCTEN
jgi:hypothetical protein